MLRISAGLLTRTALSGLAVVALATSAQAQSTKTIQVAAHYTPEQLAPVAECFTKYQTEHPDIKIEYQQASYADFLQTILTSRASGTSPDIYNIYSIWAPQLAAAGALDTPPQDIQDYVKANYAEGTVGAATINGTLYGIPTELSVYMLIYNKKLFADAGITAPPKTWAELKADAAAITKKNDQGNITTGGYAYGPSVANAVHVFYSQMYAAGVPPYADDYKSTNFTSPEAVKILQEQADLYKEGITSNAITVSDFAAGAVGMAIMANWQKSNFKEAFGDAFLDTVGVAPIPTDGPGGTMLYSFLWAVDSNSDVKPEAWALLKWLTTAETEGGISCTGAMLQGMGAITGNKNDLTAMGDDLKDSFSAPFVEAVNSGMAKTQPNVPQSAELDRILRSYIEQAWAGTISAEEALNSANTEIQAILDEQQ